MRMQLPRRSRIAQTQALFLYSGLLLAPSAYAEVDSVHSGSQDAKYQSGASCGATRHADLFITKTGQALNASTTSAMDITCSLERDLINTRSMSAKIWVFKATAEDMTCILSARKMEYPSGGALATKIATGTGVQLVTFDPLLAPGAFKVNYFVSCKVPKATSTTTGRSGILSIESIEAN